MEQTLAAVLHGAEDLRVREIPYGPPGPHEVALDMAYGGICGSDLHYYRHGRGSFSVVREPLVLGHEVVGRVAAYGDQVPDRLRRAPGTPVAVNPATTCGLCEECRYGAPQVCRAVDYLGSAARLPHTPGALARRFTTSAGLVHPLPEGVDIQLGALAEPLAVALHGLSRAPRLAGAEVLVTGAGPIGLLVAAAARAYGAAGVTLTDVRKTALDRAQLLGVARTVDVGDRSQAERLAADGPVFDVAIEASGNAQAILTAAHGVRPGGTLVQLGMPAADSTAVPLGRLIAGEIDYRTSLRFGFEFPEAVRLLGELPELQHLISSTVALSEASKAFLAALDGTECKVLIDLAE